MSASREKKNRQEVAASGVVDPKTARQAQEQAKERRSNRLYAIIAIAFVVIAIGLVVWNSNIIQRGTTAVTVEGESYSAAEVGYYYHNAYNSIVNSKYASLYGIDKNTSLSQQSLNDTAKMMLRVSEDMTWDAYFRADHGDVPAVSTVCCWLNWGFGLVAGALLAKEVAKRVPTVDYPLLIASAYSGFVIWHAGLSGSIPLTLVTGAKFGEVTYQAAITETIFHPMNIIMCAVVLLAMPFINYAMHPDRERAVTIDPTLLVEDEDKTYEINTPAEKLEHSKILWGILCLAFLVYIIYYFITNGFTLGLNIVNMIFMFLGILLHGDLRRYVDAVAEAAGSASGVLLQFPFYAGIMGMMVVQNEAGVSLAGVISQFFVNISNNVTFPMLSFLAAGIVNFFVPSGGGQWAVQGPIMMPAGAELGIGAGRTAMAIAWGDQWTNMIQPFWALPALGIAKLSARDIMGYLVVVLLFVGLVACLGFLAWGLLF